LAADLHNPPLNEGDTRAKLIDSAIHERGWTVDYTLVQGAHPCADELTSRCGFFEETRVHI